MSDIKFWLLVQDNKFRLQSPDNSWKECSLNRDALYNLYKEAGYNPITQKVGYSSTVEIQDPGQVLDDVDPFEEAQAAFKKLLKDAKKKCKGNCKCEPKLCAKHSKKYTQIVSLKLPKQDYIITNLILEKLVETNAISVNRTKGETIENGEFWGEYFVDKSYIKSNHKVSNIIICSQLIPQEQINHTLANLKAFFRDVFKTLKVDSFRFCLPVPKDILDKQQFNFTN